MVSKPSNIPKLRWMLPEGRMSRHFDPINSARTPYAADEVRAGAIARHLKNIGPMERKKLADRLHIRDADLMPAFQAMAAITGGLAAEFNSLTPGLFGEDRTKWLVVSFIGKKLYPSLKHHGEFFKRAFYYMYREHARLPAVMETVFAKAAKFITETGGIKPDEFYRSAAKFNFRGEEADPFDFHPA